MGNIFWTTFQNTKCQQDNYLDNNELSPYNNNGEVIFYYNDIEVVNE